MRIAAPCGGGGASPSAKRLNNGNGTLFPSARLEFLVEKVLYYMAV